MEHVEEYVLLATKSSEDMNAVMRKKLFEGYQPWGSPSVNFEGTQRFYIQAVVKYKKVAPYLQPPR
jgi:hypothetical protein